MRAMNTDEGKTAFIREELSVLAPDLKRMLRVQLKEFVHMVEDVQYEKDQNFFPHISQPVVSRNSITYHVA